MENHHYVRIYDGNSSSSSLLAELTGYGWNTLSNVSSCSNEMHVVLSSNNAVGGGGSLSGYYAKIHVSKAGNCTQCSPCGANEGPCESNDQCSTGHNCISNSCPDSLGFSSGTNCCKDVRCGLVDMKSGSLLSPYYPNNYKNDLECPQLISVDQGKIITIQFEHFNVRNFIVFCINEN